MPQGTSWGSLERGDWLLEERVTTKGQSSFWLVFIQNKEESLGPLPQDLVEVLKRGGANVSRSEGFES